MPKRTPSFTIAQPTAARTIVSLTPGYDHNWRKLRKRRLDAEPLCRHCTGKGYVTAAVEVDHIEPKALGGTDAWDNTQSLCHECHVAKTTIDTRRMRRGW